MALLAKTKWGEDGIWAEMHCGQSGGTEEWEGSITIYYDSQGIGYIRDDGTAVIEGDFHSDVETGKNETINGEEIDGPEMVDMSLRLSLGDIHKLGLITSSILLDNFMDSGIWEKPEESKEIENLKGGNER